MWSEWLARTLKPRPARSERQQAALLSEERPLARDASAAPDAPALREEYDLPPRNAALERAGAATRGSL